MPRKPRPSTSTVTAAGSLVPWLAATGPLAYSPEDPPASDYYFQYGWVLPGILSDRVNKRCHFYFGETRKKDAARLLEFWDAAMKRRAARVTRRGPACG